MKTHLCHRLAVQSIQRVTMLHSIQVSFIHRALLSPRPFLLPAEQLRQLSSAAATAMRDAEVLDIDSLDRVSSSSRALSKAFDACLQTTGVSTQGSDKQWLATATTEEVVGHDNVYVALFDYDAVEHDELSFRKGQVSPSDAAPPLSLCLSCFCLCSVYLISILFIPLPHGHY